MHGAKLVDGDKQDLTRLHGEGYWNKLGMLQPIVVDSALFVLEQWPCCTRPPNNHGQPASESKVWLHNELP